MHARRPSAPAGSRRALAPMLLVGLLVAGLAAVVAGRYLVNRLNGDRPGGLFSQDPLAGTPAILPIEGDQVPIAAPPATQAPAPAAVPSDPELARLHAIVQEAHARLMASLPTGDRQKIEEARQTLATATRIYNERLAVLRSGS